MNARDELEAKEYRVKMGFTTKREFAWYIQRKGVPPPPVSWTTIGEHAAELCDQLKRLNSHVLPPAFQRDEGELNNFLDSEIHSTIKNCKQRRVVEKMRNEKRTREDVFVNWLVGRAAAEFFKPAIAKYFSARADDIRSIGDDNPDASTFRRTGKADFEVNAPIGGVVRVEVQAALQPVSDIKRHKVENAAKIWDGGSGVATYCFHFDLCRGRMSVVPLHLMDPEKTEWVWRKAMACDVVPLGESHVCWVFQRAEMTILGAKKSGKGTAVGLARAMAKTGTVLELVDWVAGTAEVDDPKRIKENLSRAFGGKRAMTRAATLEDAKLALSSLVDEGSVRDEHLPSELLLQSAFGAAGRLSGEDAGAARKAARAELLSLWEQSDETNQVGEEQWRAARRIALGEVVGAAYPVFGTEVERNEWHSKCEGMAKSSGAIIVPERRGNGGGVGCRVDLADIRRATKGLEGLVRDDRCPRRQQTVEACVLALGGVTEGEVGLSRHSSEKHCAHHKRAPRERGGF